MTKFWQVRVLLGLDVGSDEKTDAFFDALQKEGVSFDVLVNAAGVATWQFMRDAYPGTTEPMGLPDVRLDVADRVFAVNAPGPGRNSKLRRGDPFRVLDGRRVRARSARLVRERAESVENR